MLAIGEDVLHARLLALLAEIDAAVGEIRTVIEDRGREREREREAEE